MSSEKFRSREDLKDERLCWARAGEALSECTERFTILEKVNCKHLGQI